MGEVKKFSRQPVLSQILDVIPNSIMPTVMKRAVLHYPYTLRRGITTDRQGMHPDYPTKIFADKRMHYVLLLQSLAEDAPRLG